MIGEGMLELDHVGVKLDEHWVIRDIDLVGEAGEAIAVVGANGAGKTTLLRVLAGVLPLDRGFISLSGEPLRGAARRRVGFVPEAADPPGFLTARDLLAFTAALRAAPVPAEEARRRLYPASLENARLATMSLGERRRVCLAAALIGEPALLVLDEPENGLDAGGVDVLVALLRAATARGAVVVVATHDAALRAALACREMHLASGRLATS
jgi:ABC-type multidrug transport system ATPase subunit